jgi:transcriptional regulator with XRE-family HTH domain
VSVSPALARRQLRFALRRAREAAALTQGQVAHALEWSISKVNRIETGDVTVSAGDLKVLLELLNVTDPATVDEFTGRARASRRHGWWDSPEFRPHLTKATRQLIEFEGIASEIWSYQPTMIPGILQTEVVANEILSLWEGRHPPGARAAKVASRIQRRQYVLDRSDPPDYRLILDESAVGRIIRDYRTTAEQFTYVLSLVEAHRIKLRIIPGWDGLRYAMAGPFTLFAFDDGEQLLYQEGSVGDQIVGLPEMVEEFRELFQDAWERSLSIEASTRLLRARAATMLADADRAELTRGNTPYE